MKFKLTLKFFFLWPGEAERVRVPGEEGCERAVAAFPPHREELLPQQVRQGGKKGKAKIAPYGIGVIQIDTDYRYRWVVFFFFCLLTTCSSQFIPYHTMHRTSPLSVPGCTHVKTHCLPFHSYRTYHTINITIVPCVSSWRVLLFTPAVSFVEL